MISDTGESILYPILNPRSIVFYGASNRLASMGTSQLVSLKALGFEGPIYPVHPSEETVQGLRAYRSLEDLPEVPDLAVMVLPSKIVPDILEQCGRKGIGSVVVVSGGFREIGGEGATLQAAILEVARRYGIRLLGPNCIGVINPHHRLNTTFLQYKAGRGFIGMASQSGSFVTQMSDYLSRSGLGFSAGISLGNEADIDMVDCLEYLNACPNTRVIALYIEAIRRGRAFIETARKIVPNKPIVAFYVGGSEAGRRASFSHTGAMAGPDKLYSGAFRQSGVIRAYSIEEMFDFCGVLGVAPGPAGNRVLIQTHSGGPGAAAADACGRAGLELPALSGRTREKLEPFMPHTGSLENPVDITYAKNPLDYFYNIPGALLDEDNAEGLLIYFLVPTKTVKRALENSGVPPDRVDREVEKIIKTQCRAVSGLVEKTKKPVLGYSFRTRDDLFIRGLQDMGIPVLAGPERAARAFGALVYYESVKRRFLDTGGEPDRLTKVRNL